MKLSDELCSLAGNSDASVIPERINELISELCRHRLDNMENKIKNMENISKKDIVSEMKKFICENYTNQTLNISMIVDYFNITPYYASNIFKKSENTGNCLDVTIDYYDGASGTPRLYYYPDGSSNTSNVSVAATTGSNSWKSATKRISGAQFVASTNMENTYQLSIIPGTGNAIKKVTVTPVYDAGAIGLTATATYTDGIALSWSKSGTTTVEKYEIWRGGSKVYETTGTKYNDRGLTADTPYSYQIKPVYHGKYLTASSILSARTKKPQLYMTLPFNSNYTTDTTASATSESKTDSEGTDYTANGLTFRFQNDNRWRRSVTVARYRGGKYCRATVMRNTQGSMTRPALSDYYDWNVPSANRQSSQMLFKVDNSIIPTTQRDIIIEFDYFGDTNSDQSCIELKYLTYNSGATPTITTKFISMTKDNAWHTESVTLNNAQFDKSVVDSNNLNDGNGRYVDFQIGMGGNRGGFASTYVKVYMPDCVPMPE